MVEYNDEFFINLVMKLSEKNQEVYNTWAVWCDESNDKYQISSRVVNGEVEFFTNARPDEEIQRLHKTEELKATLENLNLDMRKKINKEYVALAEKFMDSDAILTKEFISYDRFKELKEVNNQ